jgi:chromosome segregation ATPase
MATNNIIKLREELLAINEQRTLVEQELKVMKEKRAKIVDATEAAKSALRERQKRTKEIMANAQQAVRKLEAAEANELSNSPK